MSPACNTKQYDITTLCVRFVISENAVYTKSDFHLFLISNTKSIKCVTSKTNTD